MDEFRHRSLLILLIGGGTIALATAWLRAYWVWWWPVVVLSSGGASRVRLLALIVGLAGSLLGGLAHRYRSSIGLLAGTVAAGVLIGLVIGTAAAEDGDSPSALTPEYAMMVGLFDVTRSHVGSAEITGGLMSTTIAVVDDAGVNRAAIQLRRAICDGFDGSFLHHLITFGGPDAALVGRTLLKAVRWLPKHKGSGPEILIVTPSPIPDNARQALGEKGIRIAEVEYQFPDPLPEGGQTYTHGPGRRR